MTFATYTNVLLSICNSYYIVGGMWYRRQNEGCKSVEESR